MLLVLMLLAVPASAHTGPDAGAHHALPALLVWLPFAKAAYDAGLKTCLRALWHWLSGGGA